MFNFGFSVEKMSKTVKNQKLFVKDTDHLSMYAHESPMKLSFGGTLDTYLACGALKKFYMKNKNT